jgi:hypothetical protein
MENRRWCVASMQQNRCLYGGFGMWRWLVKLSRWVRWLVKLSSSVGVGKVAKRAVGACSPWMIGFCVPSVTGCSLVDLSLVARVARRHVVRWYSSSYGPTWTNWANITNLVCKLSTTAAIYLALFVLLKFGCCWCCCWFVIREKHYFFAEEYRWGSAEKQGNLNNTLQRKK